MSDCYAVLLDTVSIQNYIFQSNKLKENVGASHLVRQIYENYLACALSQITSRSFQEECSHLDDWKESDAEKPDCSKTVDIGYIGGGNALLFFQSENQAKRFIETWTRLLLIHAPGLTTAAAYDRFSAEQFQENLKELFGQLEKNKSRHSPITSLPRHGITAECARSGVSAEIFNELIDEYLSAGVNAKIEAASVSKREIEEHYLNLLGQNYCFSNELDDLGGIEGEDSHIAIVHIDGNDIGHRFKKQKSIGTIRKLSMNVDQVTRAAFDAVVETTVGQYKKIMESLGFDPGLDDLPGEAKRICPTEHVLTENSLAILGREKNFPEEYLRNLHRVKNREYGSKGEFIKALQDELKKKLGTESFQFSESERKLLLTHAKKRKILPIRPIILGGDDLTFVCDGKLGIYFAKIFIEKFEEESAQVMPNQERLTACAGVAIIKTKYPFYRGYWLAEELCANAKKKRKTTQDWESVSVLDFHVSLGGVAGPLQEIRRRYYGHDDSEKHGKTLDLLYRPFKILPEESTDDHNLNLILKKARQLGDDKTGLPGSKRHELREVLRQSEDAWREYVQALEYRGRKLPEIEGRQYHKTLVENNETPYFDMIEILRFCPDFALQETGGKS